MKTRAPLTPRSRFALAFVLTSTCAAIAVAACHNQSTNNDQGQAEHGPNPDSTAIPPRPMVVGSPASSVAAANLARTVPPGAPNHDAPAVCHVSIGNETAEGRPISVENTGNVGILAATAVVYAYDPGHKQIARIAVPLFGSDAGAPVLQPRDGVRHVIPMDRKIAENPNDWIVPVLSHVEFADGTKWDAPAERVPPVRAFEEETKGEAVN